MTIQRNGIRHAMQFTNLIHEDLGNC